MSRHFCEALKIMTFSQHRNRQVASASVCREVFFS